VLNSLTSAMKISFFLLCLTFLLLSSAMVSFADDLDTNRQQLAGIEQRLEKTLADLARNRAVESDVLDELDQVDRQLGKLRRRVASEKKSLKSLNESIAVEQARLSEHKEGVAALQIQVQKRLVALYKSEQSGILKTLFSAQNLSRLLEDYDYLGRVVLHDRNLLADFRLRIERQQLSLDRLAADKERQQKLTATLKREEDSLQRTVRLKNRYLAAVRNDRSVLDRMAKELKARAERLTELVTNIESGVRSGADGTSLFALQKGFLPWPVKGQVKNSFGSYKHAELGTLLDKHGIDIFAGSDSVVQAVWDGRVAFAKRFMGYGNMIIIDHEDGYYSLYAQIHKLTKKTDDRVKKGDLIAYTGFDGADYLYFEIRQGRTPIDPLLWLEKH